MCAFRNVNMSAALILPFQGKARELGVDEERENVLKIPCLSTKCVYGLISCNDVPRTLRQKHVSEEKKKLRKKRS